MMWEQVGRIFPTTLPPDDVQYNLCDLVQREMARLRKLP